MFGLFKRGNDVNKKIDLLDKNLKSSFAKIKDEFEDHLLAVNENTNEIQSNYEYLCEIDSKLDKLAERIDEISIHLNINTRKQASYLVSPLSEREQEIFLVFYSISEEGPVSLRDISLRTGLDEQAVMRYLQNIVKKGVPVNKHVLDNCFHFSLNEDFRRMQAKQNIVGVSEILAEQIASKRL